MNRLSLNSLHPLFKWFGSKWSSSKHYPAPLPGLPIFEPFAGSAGYSLNHYRNPAVLWDINPHVQTLWKWFIEEATTELVQSIPLDLPIGADIRDLPNLSYGQKLLIKQWQRTNTSQNCWTTSKWGNLPGQWTKTSRDRVAKEVMLIKHWKFEEINFTERGTYMIDPPYFYNYNYGVKDFDYNKLVDNVSQIPQGSLIIACEAVCPKTGAIPDYLPFQPSHSQVTSRRKASNNHHSKELVYVKYT